MEELNLFFHLDLPYILIGIFAILEMLRIIITLLEWVASKFGIESKWRREKKEEHDLLMQTADHLNVLQEKHEEDVRQSIRHDKIIKEDLANLASIVEEINRKLDIMEGKNDANERAKLKDRIAQAYRKHSETKEWTSMEEETFHELISDYELHGGKNSFVHTVCEPESYSWKIVD